MWAFSPGARFTTSAHCQMRDDAARILARVRVRRVRAGYWPNRVTYLHRACCDVGELVQEVQRWGRSWPITLVVFWAVAERAWLHPEAAQFTFVPHLAKLAAEAFIVEQLMGERLGGLEAFRDEGEWISVADSFEVEIPTPSSFALFQDLANCDDMKGWGRYPTDIPDSGMIRKKLFSKKIRAALIKAHHL
jgi:hypothetical protein